MLDVYRVGVSIGMQGDLAAIIDEVAEQFSKLDAVIDRTKTSTASLADAMHQLATDGRAAAESWGEAAGAIERAASAASRIQARNVTAAAEAYGLPSGRSSPASTGSAAGPAPLPSSSSRDLVPMGRRDISPFWNGNTEFTLQGNPYTPYGDAPSSRYRGPGTAMVPFGSPMSGFTMGEGEEAPGRNAFPRGEPYYGGVVPYTYYGDYLPPGSGAGGHGGLPARRGGPTINGTVIPPGGGSYGPYGAPFGNQAAGSPPGGGGGGGRGGGGGPGGQGHGFMSHGEAIAGATTGYFGLEWIDHSIQKAAEYEDWMHRLAAQGFTGNDLQKAASDAALHAQQTIKPTDLTGNLKLLSEIQATVQNPYESLALLPEFAGLEVQLARAGDTNGASEMLSAIKAGEYMGVLSHKNPATGKTEVDPKALDDFVHKLLVSNVIAGSTVGPTQFLQFLRSSSYAGAMLSDNTLFARELALIQSMGASGAGRGLLGLTSQWGAGNMSEVAANMAIDLGIIAGGGHVHGGKSTNPYIKSAGIGNYKVLPGGFGSAAEKELAESPDKFILDYLVPKMDEYLRRQIPGFDKMSPEDKERQLQFVGAGTLSSRQPGGRLFAEAIRVQALMDRDEQAYKEALNRPLSRLLMENNPMVDILGLGSSYSAFQTQVGVSAIKPATEAMNGLTTALNGLSGWATSHEKVTQEALIGLGGALTFMAGAGVIALLLTLGGTTGALAALGAGISVLAFDVAKSKSVLAPYAGIGAGAVMGAGVGLRIGGPAGALAGGVIGGAGGGLGGYASWYDSQHSWASHLDDETAHLLSLGLISNHPNAPISGSNAPIDVRIVGTSTTLPTTVTNTHDLAHGISQQQAHALSGPPTGISGPDITMDSGAAYSGILPIP